MKTITIAISFNERELELLRLGKCDKPNPHRIKMQLLSEAARNLRNMSETVMQEARGNRVNTKAELRELNRQRRVDGLITGGDRDNRRLAPKRKPKRVPHQGKTLLVYGDELDQLPSGTTGRVKIN